jgi:hypothetical protein
MIKKLMRGCPTKKKIRRGKVGMSLRCKPEKDSGKKCTDTISKYD